MSVSTFRAPLWLKDPHAQTIFPHVFRTKRMKFWRRERIICDDGDFFDIDQHIVPHRPIVILIHGLEGSSHSPYMVGAAHRLIRAGIGVVAYNMRSCSGELNRSVSFYHSGYTEDLRFLTKLLHERHGVPIGGLGFSLGGNMLLRCAGEDKERSLFSAVMAVSTPISLSTSTHALNSWQGRFYEKRFLRILKAKVRQKSQKLEVFGIDIAKVLGAKTLREFDRHLTAPTFGFSDEEDYYKQASAITVLGDIRCPILLLQSKDDPMLSKECYPQPTTEIPFLHTHYTKEGGHVGFIYGSPWRPRYFIEEQAQPFFCEHLLSV